MPPRVFQRGCDKFSTRQIQKSYVRFCTEDFHQIFKNSHQIFMIFSQKGNNSSGPSLRSLARPGRCAQGLFH